MNLKHNSNELEVRSAPMKEVRVSTAADGTHTVRGYAITFNTASVDLGGFTEFVAPGALTRTLAGKPDILCLRDHKQELLLGRTTSGTLNLSTDDTGLQFSCSLPATTAGNDLAESLRRGDIDSCSFGFSVAQDDWTRDTSGRDVRTLLDVDLFEISVVSFPAYEATSASLRTAPLEVRTRLTKRSDDDSTDSADNTDEACLCPCPECAAGDCADCSDPDCDFAGCSCDNEERTRSRKQKHAELRLRLLEMNS